MKSMSLIALAILLFSYSCKKCTTCTYNDKTTTSDSTLTEEICNTGKVYENQKEQYELAGWVCE